MNKNNYRTIGFFFGLSFALLFLVSPDSYTHDMFQRTDSANFYTSGKSMFSGLIPYVNFADSKGPLLWTIYGIAYLINSYSYVGVFWLSVILYTYICFFSYKLSLIFLKNHNQAILVSVLMICVYLCPWFHYEVRAEDWILFFIVLSFYRMCLFLYTDEGKKDYSLYKTCFILGVSFISTFFIKYNSTVMLGLTYIYFFYAIVKEKKNILKSFLFFVSGICVLVIPWIIYSKYIGCYEAFIQEYITNTLHTVESNNTIKDYVHEWLLLTYDTHCFLIFTLSCIGAIALSRKVNKYKSFFLLSFLLFYAIAIHRTVFLHWYYISVCLFFLTWVSILIVDILSNHLFFSDKKILKYFVLLTILYTLFSNAFFWGFLRPTWFFRDSKARYEYYKAGFYMSQIQKPTIIYYLCGTLGFETPTKGSPATTYWTTQVGATKDMMSSQINAIKSNKADFIVAAENEEYPINETDSLITNSGYHSLFKFRTIETNFIFYTKHNLQDPPENFHVSNTDVLFKRNIFDK